MKRSNIGGVIAGMIALLLVAGGGYFWATGMITSLTDYRSPLHANPPQPGAPTGQPVTRKVAMVLLDGLSYDTSNDKTIMPFMNELRQQGAYTSMTSRTPSFSAPGFGTLLTGAWPDLNDTQVMNPPDEFSARTFTQDDIFAAAYRAGLKTAVFGHSWFEKMLANSHVDVVFSTTGDDEAADRDVMEAALPWLPQDHQLLFIHIDQIDYAGHHQGGPRNPAWNASASRSDDFLRLIAEKLDFQQDTLIIVSDHGHIDRGGHGGQDPVVLVEPFIMVGAGVIPGNYPPILQVDVAPTIAALLGTNIPALNEGHPRTEMLDLPASQKRFIQEALIDQQEQLLSVYTTAIGEKAEVLPGDDIVMGTQAAMDKARANRLFRERTWRGLAALLILAIPAVILIIRRERKVLWLLGGALLYALLFNLRYAVLARRTYSISSIASQTDIILFCAITVAIAMLISWLVVMLALRAFRDGSSKAARTTLSFTLMTIYLLAFPILLSYTMNGIFVTWTLPDSLTMFLGFLSVIQSLIVAALGLLLIGISAGIGAVVKRKTQTTAPST